MYAESVSSQLVSDWRNTTVPCLLQYIRVELGEAELLKDDHWKIIWSVRTVWFSIVHLKKKFRIIQYRWDSSLGLKKFKICLLIAPPSLNIPHPTSGWFTLLNQLLYRNHQTVRANMKCWLSFLSAITFTHLLHCGDSGQQGTFNLFI